MRHHNYVPTGLTRFFCLLLTYIMVVSSGSLVARRVRAASSPKQATTKNTPHRTKKSGKRERELLVRFKTTASDDEINSAIATYGVYRGERLRGRSSVEKIRLSAGQDVDTLTAILKSDPHVELVEPNFIISKDDTIPNDPQFAEQWALQNTGANNGTLGSDIGVTSAWDKTTGSMQTVIAVIDSGIDFTHPELKSNQWTNPHEMENGIDDDNDGLIDDLHGWDWVTGLNEIKDGEGHGTAVAGIIAAQGNNEVGISGTIWNASLMSLRVLDETGSGDISDAVEAIDYAVAHGAQIINCSWGTDEPSQALHDAIDRASRKGVLVVTSAGNNGSNIDDSPYYPASYNIPNMIAVAATDNQDNLPSWSNWSATQVTVAAPGVNILTTKMGGGYESISGTSAAAPFVSGVAGLIYSYLPGIHASGMRTAIINGVRKLGSLTTKVSSGGIINAAGALESTTTLPPTLLPNLGGSFNGGAGAVGGANGQTGTGNQTGSNTTPGDTITPAGPVGSGGGDPSLPNLDVARTATSSAPKAPGRIHANCIIEMDGTCDDGGGGGGNQPPVAMSGGPYSGTVFQVIHFDGSGSYDPDGSVVSYYWTFGDGSTGTGSNPTHSYSLAGTYSVSLTVTDDGGLSSSDYTNATISTLTNQPPISVPGGPYSGQVNQAVSFNGSGSYDPDGTISNYSWNFGDGATGSGATPTHSYTAAGQYTVSLTVTDNGGATATASTTATITSPSNGVIYSELLDPANRVGGSGEDLFSGNFNFQIPVLALPGRAATSLGLALSYNSLVWTKEGGSIGFNLDQSFPGPGFHLGFPTIQSGFDTKLQSTTFLMVAPSGARTEFRQIGTTNVYEAADSSYQQLTINNSTQMTLRTTGGSSISFMQTSSSPTIYKCTGIIDRNGNYINVTYDSLGNIATIVDTLNRIVSFNYDSASHNLTSITQTWSGSTHVWANFFYNSLILQTNYPGLTLVGASNGQSISVLTQVGLADGTAYTFNYNSYGQAYKMNHIAPDGHTLAYSYYNLPLNNSVAQNDCPRFTQRNDFAEKWNLRAGGSPTGAYDFESGAAAEAITLFSRGTSTTWTAMGGAQDSGTVSTVTAADGTTASKTYFHSNSQVWDQGLPQLSEAWSNGVRQTWSYTIWTQDNPSTSIPYIINPRTVETDAFDNTGQSKTVIGYTAFTVPLGASVNLPTDLYEYNAVANAIYRWIHTDYATSLNSTYLNLRIIGLPSAKYVHDSTNSNAIVSHVEYTYDDSDSLIGNQTGATRHDDGNFGANFIIGRGNPTRTKVFDVTGAYSPLISQIIYNITGTVASTVDPSGHTTTISYTDTFSSDPDNPTAHTYAYPTSTSVTDIVTDDTGTYSAQITSTNEYKYDTGAVTRSHDPKGAEMLMTYDSAARLVKKQNHDSVHTTDGTYTRYIYPDNTIATQNILQSCTLVATGNPEICSFRIFDGAGRTTATASDFPITGVTGIYRAQKTAYDVMGRALQTSNPIEVTMSGTVFTPYGDDAPSNGGYGWIYSKVIYDWAGRPTQSTHTDGTNTYASYTGNIGINAIVLSTDEMGRKQQVTNDFLGRAYKAEVLGTGSAPLTTTITDYNVLGQVVDKKLFQGSASSSTQCQSGTCMISTTTYDGLGRPVATKDPIETTVRLASYNPDGTVSSLTDPRGVVTSFTYDNRQEVTSVAFNPGTSGAPNTSSISYFHDAVGNRTRMIDGTGQRDYHYDTWSRMISETETFNGLTIPSGSNASYTLSYTYDLGGDLTKLTDGFGQIVNYNYDQDGQLLTVTTGDAQGHGGFTTQNAQTNDVVTVPNLIVSNFQYRAWGTLKHAEYGDGLTANAVYDQRLRLIQFPWLGGGQTITYQYNDASQLIGVRHDIKEWWDRSYHYDDYGRLDGAKTGCLARGDCGNYSINDPADYAGAYNEAYTYDAFSNMTNRSTTLFNNPQNTNRQFLNFKDQDTSQFTYDSAGNAIHDPEGPHTYDASGKQTKLYHHDVVNSFFDYAIIQGYDGDGAVVNRSQIGGSPNALNAYNSSSSAPSTYYLNSTVLGGKTINEISPGYSGNGNQPILGMTRIYAGGQQIANRDLTYFNFRHDDPVIGGFQELPVPGLGTTGDFSNLGPLGQELGSYNPMDTGDPTPTTYGDFDPLHPLYAEGGDPFYGNSGCNFEGMSIDCNHYRTMVDEEETEEEGLFIDKNGSFQPGTVGVHSAGLGITWMDDNFTPQTGSQQTSVKWYEGTNKDGNRGIYKDTDGSGAPKDWTNVVDITGKKVRLSKDFDDKGGYFDPSMYGQVVLLLASGTPKLVQMAEAATTGAAGGASVADGLLPVAPAGGLATAGMVVAGAAATVDLTLEALHDNAQFEYNMEKAQAHASEEAIPDAITEDPNDESIVLFRGVAAFTADGSPNPAFALALEGTAIPRGDVLDPESHCKGITSVSGFTSWTTMFSLAVQKAGGDGNGGVVLEMWFRKSELVPSVPPCSTFEGEWLVPRPVFGAEVIPLIPLKKP